MALAIGSEKITCEDKLKSLSAYATCMDLENFENHIKMIMEVGGSFKNVKLPDDEGAPGQGRSIFMDAYAMGARWHMDRFGSTQEQLAHICSKNHLQRLAEPPEPVSAKDERGGGAVPTGPWPYPLTRAMCAPCGRRRGRGIGVQRSVRQAPRPGPGRAGGRQRPGPGLRPRSGR